MLFHGSLIIYVPDYQMTGIPRLSTEVLGDQ